MNKLFAILSLLVFFLAGSSAYSQWRLNAYGGYGFDDDVEYVTDNGKYFNATLKGSAFYGGGFEYVLQRNYGIELLYMREDTEAKINYSYGTNDSARNTTPGIGVNYILLSGNGYTTIPGSPVEPFGSVMLGLAIFNNKDPLPGAETSSTNFCYGFRAGLNIWASNTVGLKIMGQLVSAAQAFGGGFYLGTGGVSAGVNPESSMLRFGVGGGLTFKLGDAGKKKGPRR